MAGFIPRWVVLCAGLFASLAFAADTVPPEVEMPGTQPGEVLNLNASTCAQCHGSFGLDPTTQPWRTWRGSMMAHAGEDPLWWAALAIAEQDYDGSGDLCIRCHQPKAWIGGRSTPTDGSSITANDASYGVQCDLCHRLTNPDGSEWNGVQNHPFVARTDGEGHYGAGQYVLGFDTTRYGPYWDSSPPHQTRYSVFHRSPDLCGTCHDVSNPITGDLAPRHGAQQPLLAGEFSDNPDSALTAKAPFNAPPYRYGVVERTYSEHQASALSDLRVVDILTLPAELRAGSILDAWDAASYGGSRTPNYNDGTTRYFTCQSCHMKPATGFAAGMGAMQRTDLAVHDLTGGNTWVPEAIQYMRNQGTLARNSGLSGDTAALNDGIERARKMLRAAAALDITGDTLRVINLTGHKLISGYPEGRRMWLNMQWYDSNDNLLREDGAYGPISVSINGQQHQVDSLLNLNDPNTVVYEVKGGISQGWASDLISMGSDPGLVVSFDRHTGAVSKTLGDVAAQAPGSAAKSLHFILNDTVMADNRIPPWRMSYDEAKERNALPVPASQYGNPGPGGEYDYWDEVALNPPSGAAYGIIRLLYQTTSWEYVQFLFEANTGEVSALAEEGVNLLDAWLNTGMSAPEVMAEAVWGEGGTPPPPATADVPDVVGMQRSTAEDAIEAAGLTVGSVNRQWSWYWWIPANQVLSQSPAGGTTVDHGSEVDLTVKR